MRFWMPVALPLAALLVLVGSPFPASAQGFTMGPDPANVAEIRLHLQVTDGFNFADPIDEWVLVSANGGSGFLRLRPEGILATVVFAEEIGFALPATLLSGTVSTVNGPIDVDLDVDFVDLRYFKSGGDLNVNPIDPGNSFGTAMSTTDYLLHVRGTVTSDGVSSPFDLTGDSCSSECFQASPYLRVSLDQNSAVWQRSQIESPIETVSAVGTPSGRVDIATINGLTFQLEVNLRSHGSVPFGTAFPPGNGGPDSDGDGVIDALDNCLDDQNPLQENQDLDLLGDACDPFPFDPDNAQAQCEVDLGVCEDAILNGTCDLDLSGGADIADVVLLRRILAGVPVP